MSPCTEACAAMPTCLVCGMKKHPRGRDPGVYAASGYCGYDCPGFSQEPQSGHLWPSEWAEHEDNPSRPPGSLVLSREEVEKVREVLEAYRDSEDLCIKGGDTDPATCECVTCYLNRGARSAFAILEKARK